jgi:hypothetical protein
VSNDFVATRDGVFLQNISIERIHVDQTDGSQRKFALAVLSPKQWPFHTLRSPKKQFLRGMSPAVAYDVALANWMNNAAVLDLHVRSVVFEPVAGFPGFKAEYDFTLKLQERKTAYRAVCRGLLLDEWFYGFTYSAARRYYFERDASNFEKFMQTVRLVQK